MATESSASSISLLRQTDLFRGLSEDDLAEVARRAVLRPYRRGENVIRDGDPGDWLFVVVSGRYKVVVTSQQGDEHVLATLTPPDTFGELALIDGKARSATVETVEQGTLLSLSRYAFLELLHERPAMTESLLASLGALIRRLTDQTSDLVFLDLHGRVAKLLLSLSARESEAGKEQVIDLAMTQTELAQMVGGSRQSINHILRQFENAGYIDFDGRSLRILQPAALKRRAGQT